MSITSQSRERRSHYNGVHSTRASAQRFALAAVAFALAATACDSVPTSPSLDPSLAVANGAQKIADCAIISEPGTYVLDGDLVVDDRAACVEDFGGGDFNLVGIRIMASNVSLSLAGNTIRGDGSLGLENGVGIRLGGEVENVHITGGTIDGGGLFFDGIQSSGLNVKINAVTSTGNLRFGMVSSFCGGCEYTGNTFSENGNAGIQTVFAGREDLGLTPTRITGNRFTNNGIGITIAFFSGNLTIVGNEISGSEFRAIDEYLAPIGGNKIQGNKVLNNGSGGGIFLYSNNNTVRGNQVLDNAGDGISIMKGGFFPGGAPSTGNVVQANQVLGSAGVDLLDDNDECGNIWKSNTFETDSEGDGPKSGCIQ